MLFAIIQKVDEFYVKTKRPYKLGISDLRAICRASRTFESPTGVKTENGVGAMFVAFT